jgi:hypothetical protein
MSNNSKKRSNNVNNDDVSATAAGEESSAVMASTSSLVAGAAAAAAASAAPALTPVRAVGLSSLLSRTSSPQSMSPAGRKKQKQIETKKVKIFILQHQGVPFSLALPDAFLFKDKLKALATAGIEPVLIGDAKFEKHLSLKVFYQAGIFLPEFKTLLNSSWFLTETMEGFDDPTVAFRDNFARLAGKLAYGLNSTPPSNETG